MKQGLLIVVMTFGHIWLYGCKTESKSTAQRSIIKEITVTVINANNHKPIHLARVTLSILRSNNRDVFDEAKYTNQKGECTFFFEFEALERPHIRAQKKGYFIYHDLENDSFETAKEISSKTGKRIELFLSPDSLNLINYYSKHTPSYPIDSLIHLLKTDQYPSLIWLPKLVWADIPKLLEIGNDSAVIQNFPYSIFSSYFQKDCYLGIVSLWLIESIRITEERNLIDPSSKYPSFHAYIRVEGARSIWEDPNTTETMEWTYNSYKDWWEEVENMNKEEACKIDPLKGTDLSW